MNKPLFIELKTLSELPGKGLMTSDDLEARLSDLNLTKSEAAFSLGVRQVVGLRASAYTVPVGLWLLAHLEPHQREQHQQYCRDFLGVSGSPGDISRGEYEYAIKELSIKENIQALVRQVCLEGVKLSDIPYIHRRSVELASHLVFSLVYMKRSDFHVKSLAEFQSACNQDPFISDHISPLYMAMFLTGVSKEVGLRWLDTGCLPNPSGYAILHLFTRVSDQVRYCLVKALSEYLDRIAQFKRRYNINAARLYSVIGEKKPVLWLSFFDANARAGFPDLRRLILMENAVNQLDGLASKEIRAILKKSYAEAKNTRLAVYDMKTIDSLVTERGMTIYAAAEKLGINESSTNIYHIYRRWKSSRTDRFWVSE